MTARRKTSTSTLMAGWLFADLLLGLTIVMLGAQAPPPSPTETVEAAADTAAPEDVTRLQPGTARSPVEEPSGGEGPEGKGPEKGPPAREPAEGKKESTARSGPSASPSCTARAGGVRAKPVTLSFRVTPGAGDGVLAAQVRQELRGHGDRLAGRHAGMVLTFGADSGAGAGVRLATRVNAVIRAAYPEVFGTAVTRNFHDLAAPNGSISMEVYLVTRGCSPE